VGAYNTRVTRHPAFYGPISKGAASLDKLASRSVPTAYLVSNEQQAPDLLTLGPASSGGQPRFGDDRDDGGLWVEAEGERFELSVRR
jgi:hypothetical protein